MDYVSIGPAPYDEECAQVGDENYTQKARSECQRFIALIRKRLGAEPFGARLVMQANNHDFGTYYEVVCKYNEDNEEATQYAFRCENEAPANWSDDVHNQPRQHRDMDCIEGVAGGNGDDGDGCTGGVVAS